MSDERLECARELYDRATFGGDRDALAAGHEALDAVAADLALARGRLLHGEFLAERRENPDELVSFERAAELYERLGNTRAEAEARFWVGCFHQVVRGDSDSALPALERSYVLAEQAGDPLTRSYAARHLGFHAWERGDPRLAYERLDESLRLRRQVGHRPAIAAALLALAELAGESGEPARAGQLLDEAEREARDSDAHGVLRWIAAARTELAGR